MPDLKLSELNRLYNESEQADREQFAEMRSNVLLVAGEHYSKVNRKLANQVRSTNSRSDLQKQLRLTKNHCHKVKRQYVSYVLDGGTDVKITPQDDAELQDQKDAELNEAVYAYIKDNEKLKERFRDMAGDFVEIGECCCLIAWNPEKGKVIGYEAQLDPETGEPIIEQAQDQQTGEIVEQQIPDESKPVLEGGFDFERILAFNLLRHPSTEDMKDNELWVTRQMVKVSDLKRTYSDHEDIGKIVESSKDTFVVFNKNQSTYGKSKGQTILKRFFWRPSAEYPDGWYCYATDNVILEQGPLPYGIWPIAWKGFDVYPTSPRGRSPLKIARPYQAEINRASSSMALAQITLGSDKVLYQAGTKLAPGALLPGVRGISYQGAKPEILAGRNGSQYLEYVNSQIMEMYDILMLGEQKIEDSKGNLDPYALLFRSASQKKKFGPYIEKYEEFVGDIVFTALQLAKHYLPDEALIPMVGRREMINIPEFRKAAALRTQIRITPQGDDLETQFGKQLTFQHMLQYVGGSLEKKDIGKMMKNLPFANSEDTFADFTIDEDNARNDILAIERGEQPTPNPYGDAEYMIQKLTSRMKQPDYKFLPPPVQQMFGQYKDMHQQVLQQQLEKEKAMQSELVPVDGALVSCDIYVQDPENPDKQAKRARLPQRSLEWLIKLLEAQGATMEQLEGMNQQAMAEIAQQFLAQGGGNGGQGGPPAQGQQ